MDHPFPQYLTGIQPDNTVKENSEKNKMGKNKQVACQICFTFMRSDHVKGHMKVHQKGDFSDIGVENATIFKQNIS